MCTRRPWRTTPLAAASERRGPILSWSDQGLQLLPLQRPALPAWRPFVSHIHKPLGCQLNSVPVKLRISPVHPSLCVTPSDLHRSFQTLLPLLSSPHRYLSYLQTSSVEIPATHPLILPIRPFVFRSRWTTVFPPRMPPLPCPCSLSPALRMSLTPSPSVTPQENSLSS